MNVGQWAAEGPFGSRVVNNSGPDGQFTLFVPDPLAGNGTPNPILTWGNGSLTTPSSYRALLSHYATHGFFVVASNNTNVGSGQEMIAGMRWAIAENGRTGSDYFGKLDPDAVGSIGYSQGGIGAVIAGNEPEVKTTVPIAGGDATVKNIVHPIFLIGNEDDTAAPIDVISPQFTSEDTDGPFVFGILLGTGHLETLGDGGRHRGYTTAWLAYHLLGDQEAYRVFYGDDAVHALHRSRVGNSAQEPSVILLGRYRLRPISINTIDACRARAYGLAREVRAHARPTKSAQAIVTGRRPAFVERRSGAQVDPRLHRTR